MQEVGLPRSLVRDHIASSYLKAKARQTQQVELENIHLEINTDVLKSHQ